MSDYIEKLAAKVKKANGVFIAPNATVIGDVNLGPNVSVWFGAVIRGDSDSISIGENSNIQDNCVLHVDPGKPVNIGKEVIVGHSAIIHGASIGDNTLIGMRATLLNNVKVGKWCIIGANALLTEGTEVPDYSVVLGSPGKVVRQVAEEDKVRIKRNAEAYVELGRRYLERE
jgi:carbonic anhydrase/acetyltransferase-like protein (isoleucine patch superfamily)